MNFKKNNNRINGIQSFAISRDLVLGVKEKKVVNISDNQNVILYSKENLQSIYYSEPYFYVNDIYGLGYLIHNDGEIKELDFIRHVLSTDKILLMRKINRLKNTIVYNPVSDTVLYKIPFSSTIYLYSDNLFFFKDFKRKSIISSYDVLNNLLKWEFDLNYFEKFRSDWGEERDYEIEQFIGVYNNILWLKLSFLSGGLIGLDVETGELKHQLNGIKKENLNGVVDSYLDTDKHYVFYNTHFHLLEDGRIIGLAGDRFYEVDLNKEIIEPKLYGLWEKMKNLDIDKGNISYNTIFCNGLLYFILHDQHKFGIFDIETMKISYVSDKIETADNQEARSQLKDLKVSEDKLYILDSAQTLHIFEKENHI